MAVKRRRLTAVLAVAVAGATAGALVAHTVARSSNRARCPPADLGTLLFVRQGATSRLDLGTCRRTPTKVRPRFEPTTVSPDGRYRFFFENSLHSASLAADGLPLEVREVATGTVRRVATTVPVPGFAR